MLAEPTRIGDYYVTPFDRGGSSDIYFASHVETGAAYVLKLAHATSTDDEAEVAAFIEEIRIGVSLEHPNVVRVHGSGQHDGRPFFLMDVMEGSLAHEDLGGPSRDVERILRLILSIARVVAHAQKQGVFHCDIKSGNILIDGDGEPRLADFGLARRVGGAPSNRSREGGTPGWMAPEQVIRQRLLSERGTQIAADELERTPITAATDVFSIGVLLFWMLEDALPFGDGPQYAARVLAGALPALPPPAACRCSSREIQVWLLRAIAHKAMQREPSQRYSAASDLAADLERVDRYEPLPDRNIPRLWRLSLWRRRAARWVRSHLLLTFVAIELALVLLSAPFTPLAILRSVETTMQAQNEFSAIAQAHAVMGVLRGHALRIDVMAHDEEVRKLVSRDGLDKTAPVLENFRGTFSDIFVFSADGRPRARTRDSDRRFEGPSNYAFRDYFRCARELATPGERRTRKHKVCVSRIYRSKTDDRLKLAVAAPLIDPERGFVGVISGTIRARERFGGLRMRCGQGDCVTALLGPRDRDRPDVAVPQAIVVVAHPELDLQRGDGVRVVDVENRVGARLEKSICHQLGCVPHDDALSGVELAVKTMVQNDFDDPVTGRKSIAALASVGDTGLTVLVATPETQVDALAERTLSGLRAFVWRPLVAGLLILAAFLGWPLFARALRRAKSS